MASSSLKLSNPLRTENIDTRLSDISLLTGGSDRPYALGLAEILIHRGIYLDFIGSDEVTSPELIESPNVRFLNLRGDRSPEAHWVRRGLRLLQYYARLVQYAAIARPRIFHILWNNRLELFDRTLLMLYYRVLGKRILFTAHNVNAAKRDGHDSWLNRVTLKIQYRLADIIFVHTHKMQRELVEEFGVPEGKTRLIPFGINNTIPETGMTVQGAKERLRLSSNERVLLFFGRIAPYKGLEYLIEALSLLRRDNRNYRLIIVGRPKNCPDYWARIQRDIERNGTRESVIQNTQFIPDAEIELYLKAADVLILPYTEIFQSGVLFVGYRFGVPVIAADVGSFGEDIIEGETGFLFRPRDSASLASAIESYFKSDLYRDLEARRTAIRDYAQKRYSWGKIGEITEQTYALLAPMPGMLRNPRDLEGC